MQASKATMTLLLIWPTVSLAVGLACAAVLAVERWAPRIKDPA